jgi:hypothetical protein
MTASTSTALPQQLAPPPQTNEDTANSHREYRQSRTRMTSRGECGHCADLIDHPGFEGFSSAVSIAEGQRNTRTCSMANRRRNRMCQPAKLTQRPRRQRHQHHDDIILSTPGPEHHGGSQLLANSMAASSRLQTRTPRSLNALRAPAVPHRLNQNPRRINCAGITAAAGMLLRHRARSRGLSAVLSIAFRDGTVSRACAANCLREQN